MSPSYRPPPRLQAAALEHYGAIYGRSVVELDRALAAAPGPPDLIDLTHGDTRAFEPPAIAAEDMADAIADNSEAYTAYRGSASVRARLAPRVAALVGRPVDPERELIVTPGTQGGLFAALSALVSPGEVVAVPDPEYFMDERICAYLGATCHRIPLVEDGHGLLTVDPGDLERATDTGARMLVLSHPNNPTGGVYAPGTAAELARWVTDGDRYAVVDQLYGRLVFPGMDFVTIGALPGMAERTVTLLGPSKTESMSGYRVGVAVGPPEVIDAMERVVSLTSLRTSGYGQQVLRHWMDGDAAWLEKRIAAHRDVRDSLVARLRSVPGLRVACPAGSSYVFPDVSDTALGRHLATGPGGADDHAVAVALKAAGVLVSPGYQFGPSGRGRFRINFSQDATRLAEAADRIAATLG
jgi:aspartate/methionine/tyrosine aminotransferase